MKQKRSRIANLFAGSILVLGVSSAHAVSLNNAVTNGTMNWMQDLSDVQSPTATGVVFMENSDGTSTYMGMDSVSMMVDGNPTPVWDYEWSFTADPDPFIAGIFTVTNTSAVTQIFDITFTLPISPSFTNGVMFGRLSGSYTDANSSGSATLSLNTWEGLIDGVDQMSLFGFAGPCLGTGCTVTIGEVSQGPTSYTGPVSSTIGIHMNFGLSAGDSATFDTKFEVNPIPVPAAVWLFSSGLIGLIGFARRHSKG